MFVLFVFIDTSILILITKAEHLSNEAYATLCDHVNKETDVPRYNIFRIRAGGVTVDNERYPYTIDDSIAVLKVLKACFQVYDSKLRKAGPGDIEYINKIKADVAWERVGTWIDRKIRPYRESSRSLVSICKPYLSSITIASMIICMLIVVIAILLSGGKPPRY